MSEGIPASEEVTAPRAQSAHKWFHFRWRILLLIPVALLIVGLMYGPRQVGQRRALLALEQMNAAIRTEPLPLPGVARLFGEEYTQQILDVYVRSASLSAQDLEVLRGVRTLQKLELAGSGVEGVAPLRDMPNLYILHLADTKVTDDGIAILPTLKNLGVLSLSDTRITDAGLAHVAGIPRLERLALDGTGITDEGLAHLSGLTTLKELACFNTEISDAGLKHLKPLKNLELLKIYNTKVTPEALQELQASLPKCVLWQPDPDQ